MRAASTSFRRRQCRRGEGAVRGISSPAEAAWEQKLFWHMPDAHSSSSSSTCDSSSCSRGNNSSSVAITTDLCAPAAPAAAASQPPQQQQQQQNCPMLHHPRSPRTPYVEQVVLAALGGCVAALPRLVVTLHDAVQCDRVLHLEAHALDLADLHACACTNGRVSMTAPSPSRSAHPASHPLAHNHISTKPSVPSTNPFLPAPRAPRTVTISTPSFTSSDSQTR